MKRNLNLRRLAALLLTVCLSMGALWPAMTADATSIDIDSSGFSDPQITSTTVYIWQQGLPAYTEANERLKYPVLLCWDDQYYFRVTSSFADCVYRNIGNYTGMIYHGWSNNDDDSGYINGSFDADGSMPHGAFRQNLGYTGSLLSELKEVDFKVLKNTGSYLTMSIPYGIPCLLPLAGPTANPSSNVNRSYAGEMGKGTAYAMTVTLPENSWDWYRNDYVGSRYTDGGFRSGENVIFGVRYDMYDHWTTEESFLGIPYTEHHQSTGFNWTLLGTNPTLISKYKEWYKGYIDPGYDLVIKENTKQGTCSQSSRNYGLRYLAWYVKDRTINGKKYYCFFNSGMSLKDKNGYLCREMSDYDELKNLLNSTPCITLAHTNGDFGTKGRFGGNKINEVFNSTNQNYCGFNNYNISFNCYYGVPTLMNFVQTSFSVENGQVTNFDVATALANGATVTVKDGGTLSVEGWLLNNGTIKVEEGGTLYIQDGSCVNRFRDGSSRGGGIISNGLIIVGENAKLIGGGTDGIQLGNGAHIVNYGCVASENFKVVNDHTVENRDNGFVLTGAGNGVTGCGSATYSQPLDYEHQSFAEIGTMESNATVNVVDNWSYHE